jgi:hypothetical protein
VDLIRGRSLYVKLASNAVRRSKYKQDHEKHAETRLMVVEVWYLSFSVLQIVGEQMFHSQSSVSEFLRFKSHLELSPVESYQSFDFVNFMLDGRPCFLQTDIKTPLWAFCISPVSSSISGKCGPHICGAEENPKNENFQSSC